MDVGFLLEILLKVIGGLGVFLLGMKNLSEGMQAIAGNRLRQLIGVVTENRLMAVFVGILVTCLVQSSSITTVMVVGFVNSGFMTLKQAIGVIFGANIGTTITGWLISLLPKVGKYGLPIVGISAMFFLFAKKDRIKFTAMTIMGIGMIFFGLDLMSSGLNPIRSNESYVAFFATFQASTYGGVLLCALVGCVVTVIVQSSSATLGITMALLLQGTLSFESAAALVLGENIGTTITAYLASLGTNVNAKRAAYAHIVFNILGVLWATALFKSLLLPLSYKFMGADPSIETQLTGVAMVHTLFNVTNAIIFFPFMGIIGRIVTRLAPQRAEKEQTHLAYLEMRMLDTPALGVEQSKREIMVMADGVIKMMGYLERNITAESWDEKLAEKTFRREEIMDTIQKEVTVFLGHLLAGRVTEDVADLARLQLRLADELESISDELANLLKIHLRAQKNEMDFSDESKEELLQLHTHTTVFMKMLYEAMEQENTDVLAHANAKTDQIKRLAKQTRDQHLVRLSDEGNQPLQTLVCTDAINAYRRINEHLLNVAEAIAGEK